MNKYHAVKTVVDGITFDSKAEARRYQELKLLRTSKRICNIVVHPAYDIVLNGKKICRVELDFRYLLDGAFIIYEDVKGKDNALSRLKRKLVEVQYGIKVDVIGG